MRKSKHKPQAEAEPRWTEGLMNDMQCLLLSAPEIWELGAPEIWGLGAPEIWGQALQHYCCKKAARRPASLGGGP